MAIVWQAKDRRPGPIMELFVVVVVSVGVSAACHFLTAHSRSDPQRHPSSLELRALRRQLDGFEIRLRKASLETAALERASSSLLAENGIILRLIHQVELIQQQVAMLQQTLPASDTRQRGIDPSLGETPAQERLNKAIMGERRHGPIAELTVVTPAWPEKAADKVVDHAVDKAFDKARAEKQTRGASGERLSKEGSDKGE